MSGVTIVEPFDLFQVADDGWTAAATGDSLPGADTAGGSPSGTQCTARSAAANYAVINLCYTTS